MASSRTTLGARNRVMGTIAVLAVALLVSAAIENYLVFSYLAALFIVANFGASSIERHGDELDLAPYTWLLVGLAAIFVAGFTIIWLQWNPGVTEYTYMLGLPVPTLAYFVFLWLLPLLGAFYYALVFPSIGSDDVVDDIMGDVRQVQRRKQFPLSVARTEPDGGASDARRPSPDGNHGEGNHSTNGESSGAKGGEHR
ncbi:hypothetical protein [Haladaptatus caseinilyticus]|uniref:hypothetical protein n=1 Tax=Haladaptatus caseinilyticus TaxID=2993314 RepID=UPI00224B5BF8|nr:hypothetical protein [Haladaptatus caseinilyticus]